MIVDKALDNPQVILMGSGDACLGKGRTQKFESVEVHSTDYMVRSFNWLMSPPRSAVIT